METNILLIEDNLGDIRLIQEVLRDSTHSHQLFIATDGEQAIQFLRNENEFAEKPKPQLILLDLNLPKKDGREVLAEIKNNQQLSFIPVIVFSSSEADKDIQQSYNLHANCYIVKPFDFTSFSSVIESIQNFWLAVVKLPK